MKYYHLIAATGFAFALFSCGEKEEIESPNGTGTTETEKTYILATGDLLPASAKKRTTTEITEIHDGKITVKMGDETISGDMTQRSESVKTAEPITAEKLRHVVVRETEEQTFILDGEEQKEDAERNPIIGVPVIVEFRNGEITAYLEQGAPTGEQEKKLEQIQKNYQSSESLAMYGAEPRKPGDVWDVDVSKLLNFAGGTGFSGSFTMEFKSVEEIDGMLCAKLECVFDISGKIPTGDDHFEMDLSMKGKADIVRSIEQLVDIDVNLVGTMNAGGAIDDDIAMQMGGTIAVRQTVEFD